MASPHLGPAPQQAQPSSLKRLLLRSAAFGAAFAATSCLILGGFVWYPDRPQPPKAWNTTALVAHDPPSFHVAEDSKRIKFRYSVENTTDSRLQLPATDIPQPIPSDSAAQYHERIRTYCEEHFGSVQKFVLFDDLNHYQINLPRWRDAANVP